MALAGLGDSAVLVLVVVGVVINVRKWARDSVAATMTMAMMVVSRGGFFPESRLLGFVVVVVCFGLCGLGRLARCRCEPRSAFRVPPLVRRVLWRPLASRMLL